MFESIERQNYSNYRVVYVDDASSDEQFDSLQDHLKRSKLKAKLTIKRNKERLYALRNRHEAIH